MAITQEQFDALVGKLEDFSKSNPKNYRLRVALWATLGYAYIFLVLAGLLALIGLVVLFIVYSNRINASIIKLGTRVKIIYQLGRADSDIPFGQTFLPLPKNLGFNLDLL